MHQLRTFPARIFLIGLAIRLVPVLLARHLAIGLDDMFQYDMLARSLAAGNGFRWYAPQDLGLIAPFLHLDPGALDLDPRGILTSFRAPLYPAFLAVIYSIVGSGEARFFAARLAQTVLGALLAPLTFAASNYLLPQNERAAKIAAGLVAAYPMLIIFPLALATENLFFVLVLGSMVMLFRAARMPGALNLSLSGFLLGLSALTRSVILPFAALAVVWAWFSLGQRRGALLMAGVLALTIAPWILRNSILYGRPTGIETSLGYNLYVGYHPQGTGSFAFGPSLDLLSILDDRARDEFGTRQAIAFMRQDPSRVPALALRRLGYFFGLEWRAFTYFYVNDFLGLIPAAMLVLILVVLALPFAGITLSATLGSILLPRGPQTALLNLLFVGYLLPHVFILSEERFHLVLVPFFAILAANLWTVRRATFSARGPLALSLAGLAAALLVLNWTLQIRAAAPLLIQMLGPLGNRLYLPY
jgi:hypothetical protein